ncbi:DUF192 domain-containing protein [Aquibacillus salsiterrae]|uniref:DUF192 domain-containing protein n=1 Tax=Aquibacillus salsiterrae TaxID=2950439 RepID=A0A9X4AEI7_9BACI|nr:DUF192 domain-containing protein [Aquibacillus salsiterrae]MDC3416947.1 DUF192 domain-containing protein [Aquibacillus salsiterrae]
MLELVNLSNGKIIASDVRVADSFFQRLKGLMFTKTFDSGSGLHIIPCRSVHTFFMNYAIDILYVNERLEVVAIDEAIKPNKVGKAYQAVHSVIELPAGVTKQTETTVGNTITFN